MKRRSLLRLLGRSAPVLLGAGRLPGAVGLSLLTPTIASAVTRFGRGPTRIALLLPDDKGPYRRAAAALLDGVRAAHGVDGDGIRVEVFPVDDQKTDLAGLMQRLAARSFSIAIGPMTRGSVNKLAHFDSLPVPVLTLNLADEGLSLPPDCIQFGLPVEGEGRQIAVHAFDATRQFTAGVVVPRALAIAEPGSLAQRSANAFLASWREQGGESYDLLTVELAQLYDLPRVLAGIRADAVFVALPADAVGSVRQALGDRTPFYGTSRLNVGVTADSKLGELLAMPALNGLHLVDMPWQLQPRHAAVAAYPRSERLPHLELQRLYALGIDSYRVARELLAGRRQFELDGVTGWLRLDALLLPEVQRRSTLAVYRDGMLVPVLPAAPPAGVVAVPLPPAAVPAVPAAPIVPASPPAPSMR